MPDVGWHICGSSASLHPVFDSTLRFLLVNTATYRWSTRSVGWLSHSLFTIFTIRCLLCYLYAIQCLTSLVLPQWRYSPLTLKSQRVILVTKWLFAFLIFACCFFYFQLFYRRKSAYESVDNVKDTNSQEMSESQTRARDVAFESRVLLSRDIVALRIPGNLIGKPNNHKYIRERLVACFHVRESTPNGAEDVTGGS